MHKAQDIPKQAVEDKPTIVYWNILGLVQSIRLALVQAQVDFVDVRIQVGDPSSPNSRSEWFQAKEELKSVLDFPNLPYFFDGDVSITQSNAILRCIGRKYNVMGTAGQEHIVDLCLDELSDLEGNIARRSYQDGPEALVQWVEEDVSAIIPKWEKLLGGKTFLTGDAVSIADFKLYVFLFKITKIQNEIRGNKSTEAIPSSMQNFMKRIEELPSIKAYMASPDYQTTPINNPSAKWTG